MPRPVLVTAGATRNPVDAMRFLSARSSGRTGAYIAHSLSHLTQVTLLGSPQALLRNQAPVQGQEFGDTRDLMAKMQAWLALNPAGAIVHAAAVGDYEVIEPPIEKVSSQRERWVIELTQAPKIADRVMEWDAHCMLITFKAAGPGTTLEQLAKLCKKQLRRTGSSLVFGNVIGDLERTATVVDVSGCEAFDARGAALSTLVARIGAAL